MNRYLSTHLVIILLFSSQLDAQTIEFVKDFPITTQSCSISYLSAISSHDKVFFSADDGIHGKELWISDGTEAGTKLVKDINPGAEGSIGCYGNKLIASGNQFYFVASDRANGFGCELWVSDGTEEGTHIVKDMTDGIYDSYFRSVIDVNGVLFFWINNQIWKTNGGENSTVLIAENIPDQTLHAVNNYVFFHDTNGYLLRSDGTPEGTVYYMYKAGVIASSENTILIGKFDGNESVILKSDGTESGTEIFAKSKNLRITDSKIFNINENLFFNGYFYNDDQQGLWKYNENTNEFTLLKEDLTAYEYVNLNGILIFSGVLKNGNRELWKSDGTPEGTHIIQDVSQEKYFGVQELLLFREKVFFNVTTSNGKTFWETDGTARGTSIFKKDISNSNQYFFTPLNNSLLFVNDDRIHGRELWKTDGTTANTVLVKDINQFPNKQKIASLHPVNNDIFVSVEHDNYKWELWKSNQNKETIKLKDFEYLRDYINFNDTLFFSDREGLWKTDGTPEGTIEIDTLRKTLFKYQPPKILLSTESLLYFNAGKFCKTDGTNEGTSVLLDRNRKSLDLPENLTNVNGLIYLSANNYKLYRTDGTQEGTYLVKDIPVHSGYKMAHINDTLFFISYEDGVFKLMRSDGTAEGTYQVMEGLPFNLTTINDTLYFFTTESTNFSDTSDFLLWKSNGIERQLIDSLRFKNVSNFIDYKGQIYFRLGENRLWKINGTKTDTQPALKKINNDPSIERISAFTIINNTLYFKVKKNDAESYEIWKTDGTEAGTKLVVLVNAIYNYSYYDTIAHTNDAIYFVKNLGEKKESLWRIKIENESPEISEIPDQAVRQGDTLRFDFSINDKETDFEKLQIAAFSDAGEIIPTKNISISGTKTEKIISIVPSEDKIGEAVIFIQVSDGIDTMEKSFKVTVVPNSMDFSPEVIIIGDTIYCEGDSTQLIAPVGISTYHWSNGATSQKITVDTTGIYSVQLTDALGRESQSSKAVKISVISYPEQPVINILEGNLTFCEGDSVVLAAPESYTYVWSDSTNAQTIRVHKSGNFQVKVSNEFGCESIYSERVEVTVNAMPEQPVINILEGNLTFCEGGSVVLAAPKSYAYVWSDGTNTQTIRVHESEEVQVKVSNEFGCESICSETVSVVAHSLPELPIITSSEDAMLCEGDSVVLTAPSGYPEYEWSNDAHTPKINVKEAGSYQVKVIDDNGCTSEYSEPFDVVKNDFAAFIEEEAGIITATEGELYQWFKDGEEISQITQSITAEQSGTYHVIVIDSMHCHATSNEISIQITGINEPDVIENINIYPNPVKEGIINLKVPIQLLNANLLLINQSGQVIYQTILSDTHLQIDLGKQSDATYIIQINTGEKVIGKRLIKTAAN